MASEHANCLSPDELAAWVGGQVGSEARQRALEHVERCGSCREAASLLALLEPSDDASPARTPGSTPPPPDAPDASAAELAVVGQRIGRFVVRRVLGRGGMGVVLLARDERLERDVALKLVLSDEAGKSVRQERLADEARALAALSHPNLVQVFELGEHRGLPFLVMELVSGVTLRAHVALEKPSWREGLRLCLAAADGVAALHEAGFVHRDIKPDNVMLAADGRVVVVDLGLAKRSAQQGDAGASGPTKSGVVVGTPRYLAPERVAGRPADARSDVYALAAMTLEMLRACEGKPSERALAVLSRGADPDPELRFASIEELAGALRVAAAPRRGLVIAIAGAGVAAIAIGAFALPPGAAPLAREPVSGAETTPQPSGEASASSLSSPPPRALIEPPPAELPSALETASSMSSASGTPSASSTQSAYAQLRAPPSAAPAPASAGRPWVSGSVPIPSSGSGWISVDTSPMPPVFSPAFMKRMGRVPTTYDLGYEKMMEQHNGCTTKDDTVPVGVDWGVVEKSEVIEVESEDGSKSPALLFSVKAQQKRYVFDGLLAASYLDALVGAWVFVCPAAPVKRKLPAGWEGEFVWMKSFGPIAGPPDWASRKPRPTYVPREPGMSGPRDKLRFGIDPDEWRLGDGPLLFAVKSPPPTPLADGPADMGRYFLDVDGKSRNKELLAQASAKKPLWVIARYVALKDDGGTDHPVLRLVEVLPSLFEPPRPRPKD